MGHSKAIWPFFYLIFKNVISQSPPSPSPSHSAVLAHSSVRLTSLASSNIAFLPLCPIHYLPLLPLILSHPTSIACPPFGHNVITPPSFCFIMPLIKLSLLLGQFVHIPYCFTVSKPNSTTLRPGTKLNPLMLAYLPSRCSRRHYPGSIISS